MENDLAAVKKFLYMIEGRDANDDAFTVFEPELPAVSIESAQALCDKWHKQNPLIRYEVVMYMKPNYC